jgi:hypothetical protein
MANLKSLTSIFRKKPPEVSGITIYFLQRRMERFSDEQLSLAMQRGWRKPYDEQTFYGMSTFDGEGGLLKFNAMFFPLQHFERRLDSSVLGTNELPRWADHTAYTSFGYACPGGIPEGKLRETFYTLLGRFCAALLNDNTKALYFVEDRIFLRYDPWLVNELRSRERWNPRLLSELQLASGPL